MAILLVFVGVTTVTAATVACAPIADVPLLALSLPDQLPVLLQEQTIVRLGIGCWYTPVYTSIGLIGFYRYN